MLSGPHRVVIRRRQANDHGYRAVALEWGEGTVLYRRYPTAQDEEATRDVAEIGPAARGRDSMDATIARDATLQNPAALNEVAVSSAAGSSRESGGRSRGRTSLARSHRPRCR